MEVVLQPSIMMPAWKLIFNSKQGDSNYCDFRPVQLWHLREFLLIFERMVG